MTVATLLFALITAASPNPKTSEPILLDFHAHWCGPCRQMRPAVEQLVRKGYPIKSIDIDQAPDLAEKYNVQAVPTFIVADASGRELDRSSGNQPAAQLAKFYLGAKSKLQPRDEAQADDDQQAEEEKDEGKQDDQVSVRLVEESDPTAKPESEDARPAPVNPKPWETVVRIRVLSRGSVGFGSGTIIHSSPKESLILTCAHIFKLDGQKQAAPEQFPRKIKVDLFDGKLQGTKPATVHFVESVDGEAIDYDFTTDVGLIRIRPGRRLPSARVVPAHWDPRPHMKMMTVGCSEGQDATAWYTLIVNPQMRGLAGNPNYRAIECEIAPKQGRSGGGLFTTDGYIAGVCNFAEPRGDHGLYATPRSIYSMLDRNSLMALYAPVTRGSGVLVADRNAGSRTRRGTEAPFTVARGQSPDREEPDRVAARDDKEIGIPPPEFLGIKAPGTQARLSIEPGATSPTRRTAWHPTHAGPPAKSPLAQPLPRTEQTDLNLDSNADHDRFSQGESERPAANKQGIVSNPEDVTSEKVNASSSQGRSRWRPKKSSEGSPIIETDR